MWASASILGGRYLRANWAIAVQMNLTMDSNPDAQVVLPLSLSGASTATSPTQNSMDVSSNATKTRENIFEGNYDQILRCFDCDGLLRIPQDNKETRHLSNWLSRQKNRKTLSDEEREKLEKEGVYFQHPTTRHEKYNLSWDMRYQQLISYKNEFHTLWYPRKMPSTVNSIIGYRARERCINTAISYRKGRQCCFESVSNWNEISPQQGSQNTLSTNEKSGLRSLWIQ